VRRGIDLGVIACPACELVMRAGAGACPRCGEHVCLRRPGSAARAWALLATALALYLPANLLVIVHSEQFPVHRDDTILSGIAYLWSLGSTGLAVIVFAASILVPVVKIAAIALLLVMARRGSAWRLRGRTRAYRVLEVIGHWSMLDVFVVMLLTAVVGVGRFASVSPGPAVLPFAGVVVATMLASAAFDPRAMWDSAIDRAAARARSHA
jgi:paraquat-inducible protein A